MNDWYNDPPDSMELPECCEEVMEFDNSTLICKCLSCGKIVVMEPDAPDIDVAFQDVELPADFWKIL